MFQSYDANGDGVLSKQELSEAMGAHIEFFNCGHDVLIHVVVVGQQGI